MLIYCKSNRSVNWTYIPSIDKANNIRQISNNTLFVRSVQLFNKGIYECEGTNREGRVFRAHSSILVYGKGCLL